MSEQQCPESGSAMEPMSEPKQPPTSGYLALGSEVLTEPPPLAIKVSEPEPEPGLLVLELAGEVDAHTAPELIHRANEQLDREPPPLQVIIDLEQVTFLASAGLSALVKISRHLDDVTPGALLHISGVRNRMVRRPLELGGLVPLFGSHSTLADAVAELLPTLQQLRRPADG
jgi:anti-anti-sigma factor